MKPLSYEILSKCAGKEILLDRAELEEDYGVDTSKTFEHKGILYRPVKLDRRTGLLRCEILGSKEGKNMNRGLVNITREELENYIAWMHNLPGARALKVNYSNATDRIQVIVEYKDLKEARPESELQRLPEYQIDSGAFL